VNTTAVRRSRNVLETQLSFPVHTLGPCFYDDRITWNDADVWLFLVFL